LRKQVCELLPIGTWIGEERRRGGRRLRPTAGFLQMEFPRLLDNAAFWSQAM
jgi:hypothetical protein